MEAPIHESSHGPRIGLVFVGSKDDGTPGFDDTTKQLFDLFLSRLGVRSPEFFFENPPLDLLSRSHRAASPQLRIVEPVDEVGCADQEIDVHRPVLTVLEGSKAIEDEGLIGCLVWTILLVEEKTMPAKAVRQTSNCGVGDTGFSRDLTQSGA